jgi:hypothetical protein
MYQQECENVILTMAKRQNSANQMSGKCQAMNVRFTKTIMKQY